jgi:hypothetical protein
MLTDKPLKHIMLLTNTGKSVDEEEYLLSPCTERRWLVKIFVKEA